MDLEALGFLVIKRQVIEPNSVSKQPVHVLFIPPISLEAIINVQTIMIMILMIVGFATKPIVLMKCIVVRQKEECH